jgi:hypothetical protein
VAEAQELLRGRIRELLVPGDEPIGEPGRRSDIRVVQGDFEVAQGFFGKLEEMGEVENVASYHGRLVRLGSEGRVGLRAASKSGEPTLDIALECVPEIRKIKFSAGGTER